MSRTFVGSMLASLALVACNTNDPLSDPPTTTDASLQRFSTCGALESGFVDAYTEQLVQWKYGEMWYMMEDGATPSDANDASSGSSPTDYSTTNVQEAGVDEPDMVKTNGNYIFVSDPQWYGTNTIQVVKSFPVADSSLVSTIELDGYPYSMFLNGDRLIVYSYVYDLPSSDPNRYGYGTRIDIIDVSDPANPQDLRQIDLEGWMTDARMIDNDVYTVVNTYAYMPQALWDINNDTTLGLPDSTDFWNKTADEQEAIRVEARRILRPKVTEFVHAQGAENLLPRMWDHLPGEEVDAQPISDCGDVYHPNGISKPSMLTIAHLAVNDDNGSDVSTTTLMADGWQVYASQNALYVAQSSWWWWWGWGNLDQTTQIHKFELNGADTTYVASGEIDGWIRDQFAFSEYNDNLRVATSDFWWWGCGWNNQACDQTAVPANNIFVLNQNDAALNVIGDLRGIAPNEQIQATRFLGDVGFMVTYQNTDPLFTLDLSDPTAPKLAGELTMPGYSAYLHPIDNGKKLLAVGMAGDNQGNNWGLKLDMFDVHDLAHPTILDELDISTGDYSYSEALWDHHAFTYYRDNLSLPLYAYSYDQNTNSSDYFSGLLSVNVDTNAGTLTEAGRISHQDLINDSVCLWDTYWANNYYYGDPSRDFSYCDYDWYWYATVRRSVVIGDGDNASLFSISDYGIKATDLADPTVEQARVLFYPAN